MILIDLATLAALIAIAGLLFRLIGCAAKIEAHERRRTQALYDADEIKELRRQRKNVR